MSVEVAYLADHPEAIPRLADWFFTEWGQSDPPFSREEFEAQFRERLNRDRLPLTMIAFKDGNVAATASLRIREVDTHPEYEHWLGSVYTHPEYRRRGIASVVIEALVEQARRLGILELYLYTRRNIALYARLGWRTIANECYHGREVAVMRRGLDRPSNS